MNSPPDRHDPSCAPTATSRAQFLRLAAGAAALAMSGTGAALRVPPTAPMLTRPIPASGEALPVIGLGTWQGFDVASGSAEYLRLPAVLQGLFDAGGSVIDSSPMYGRSEAVTGELLAAAASRSKAFASTVLYFVQSHLVGEAISDRALRRAFLARIDLAVNSVTIVTQALFTAHILRRLGIGLTLAVLPAVAVLGFLVLGAAPTAILLSALMMVRVLYDSSRHALAKPAREVLFTRVSREQRYKSKAFIDAAVYRGGDLVSGWIYVGLAGLGLAVGTIALLAVPVAVAWAVLGRRLGRERQGARD